MSQITIIGAGMAGLLAARMLHRHDPLVLERAPGLPHNHSAVLRFASSKVSDVLGIPFKRVAMVKTVAPWRNPVADAMAYSHKVLGEYRTDRSVVLPQRWESHERWIAPENLIERMADGLRPGSVVFDKEYEFGEGWPKVISTIPMPSLAKKMGHKDLGWKWLDGYCLIGTIKNCDAYCSVMVPDPDVPFYRASITGDQLILEFALRELLDDTAAGLCVCRACDLLGLRTKVSSYVLADQPYAKIAPIDEGARRNFIYWASTETGRAYQLGRFATWRPKLLLDDLVQDVRLIEGWITSPSSRYDQEEHERKVR